MSILCMKNIIACHTACLKPNAGNNQYEILTVMSIQRIINIKMFNKYLWNNVELNQAGSTVYKYEL